MYEIYESQLRKWWQVFNPDNKLVEIRLLGKNTYSGYFVNVDTMITQLRPLLDHNNMQYYGAMQAYFTLNEIDGSLYSREQHDVFVKKPKSTTTDGDIVRRRMILIDLDPTRSAGISASKEEFEKAHLKAVAVYRYLMKEGFKEPVITQSGNGYHLYIPCDMPNDEEHNELVKRFLQSLSNMFSGDGVDIDEKVFNPARIDKLIGTWAKKGSDTKERPWRLAKFVKIPSELSPNDDALFQKIADLLPKEEPKVVPNRRPNYQGGGMPFDLPTWLREHGLNYKEEKQGASTRYTLEWCPWVDTHSDRKKWDSALFVAPDGQITFNCQHSHCKGKTWHDVRLKYEPNAYDRPAYQPQMYAPHQYLQPQKKGYEIKGEIPELGKKWLRPSDIKKVDLSKLEGVKTGYAELDRSISKLHYGEVTVLSGSNASGKSSWLNSLILNIANQHVSSALWSGELPEPILMTWIHMVAAGKRYLKPSQYGDGKYYVPSDVEQKIDHWLDNWLLVYNTEYGSQWEQLFADMDDVVKAGVKIIILDNLMAMDINLLEGDKNEKQKQVILRLKKFAKDKQVHIIIVAHPRKSMAFLRKNDISGTADLQNAVDNIFIFHRVNNDFLRAGAEFFGEATINQFRSFGNVCEVAKNRMFGIVDLMVGMHYEIESRRFLNTPDEIIRYGWEQEPVQAAMPFGEQSYNTSDMPFAPTTEKDAPF